MRIIERKTTGSIGLLVILLFVGLGQNIAQQHLTPYDEVPGLPKSYKPALEENYPEWAKLLYQYPVNYHKINSLWKEWMESDQVEKNAISRYFQLWSARILPFVNDEGEIVLPDSFPEISTWQTENQSNTKSNWAFWGPKETFWLNESGSPDAPAACPWQVNVYSFDVSASNPNLLFAGTETGFVNKSTDKGLTWTQIGTDHVFGGGVTAMQIDPQDPDIVYVAAGSQLHKTTNGGQSWTAMLPQGNTFSADRLRIDPLNRQKIIAASPSGVMISEDGAQTWSNRWNKATYDIEIQPNNSNVIYAVSSFDGSFTLAQSSDGGVSFSSQPGFPTTIADVSGALLAVTPNDPSLIFVLMLSSNSTPLLYKGVNTGVNTSWTLLATGQTSTFPLNNGQGYFDLVLEVSPLNKNLIFAGTTTLYKSSNGGANFTAIGGYAGNFPIHPDIQDFKMLENGETWVSTDGGMTFSSDQFSSTTNAFSRNNGLVGSDMWGFDQGWNEDIVVGGRYHNGNTSIADFYQPKALRMGGAESPTGWVLQGKSRHVAFNDLGNGWILPENAEGIPEGRFIFSKYPNMEEYGGRRSNMVFHPNYYGTIYLGENRGVWKSTDMGLTYTLLHNFTNTVRYLQISRSNPLVLYVDVNGMGLYKSEDGGITWTLKPSLTNGEYGTSYWKGKLFFVISPNNADDLYVCLQNGTWSADLGKIFHSEDGGDSWTDYTGTLQEYTKCLVIQPSADTNDIVYLFSNNRNGKPASVYYRTTAMNDWEPFQNNYPVGMSVNMALPFYRDGKLRVAGNAGVWETQLLEPAFDPFIDPWIEKQAYDCMLDTLYFDDHSILNHQNVSWLWEFDPEPTYISHAESRNPKVVLGNPGSYSVYYKVSNNGTVIEKNIPDMVSATTCPSIEDCDNPDIVPKDIWELMYVDSEEVNYPGYAVMAFDDDPETIWHTRWSTGDDPYPHEIQVDMGQPYLLFDFTYLSRQDGENGRIKEYELYISENTDEWGEPVVTGEFSNTSAPQTLVFSTPLIGRYWRLKAISEVNGNPWASAAEFSLKGCTDITSLPGLPNELLSIQAFPMPVTSFLNLDLPGSNFVKYQLYNSTGAEVLNGPCIGSSGNFTIDLRRCKSGIYFLRLTDEKGIIFRVKLIKN